MINFIILINKEAQDSDGSANIANKKILSGRETKQNFSTNPLCLSMDGRELFLQRCAKGQPRNAGEISGVIVIE